MLYYGCGLIAPEALKGARVLDLGCGAGRDVYALSQMVGEEGFVVGVDMTDEQLDVARSYQDHHRQAFGYRASNVAFQKGYIENLEDLPLDPGSWILGPSTSLCQIVWSILRRISKRY
jgi:ubiquinone/menaquinone biosynthesis C-methylase UbiE